MTDTKEDKPYKKNEQIKSVILYINEHLTESLSLDVISNDLYIQRASARIFKASTGYTLNNYIAYKRLLLRTRACDNGNVVDKCKHRGRVWKLFEFLSDVCTHFRRSAEKISNLGIKKAPSKRELLKLTYSFQNENILSLFCIFNGAQFADNVDFNLTGIFHLVFNLFNDFLCHQNCLVIVDRIRFNHYADFAACLNCE